VAASTLCSPLIDGPRRGCTIAGGTPVSRLLVSHDAPFGVSLQTADAVRLPQAIVVETLPEDGTLVSLGDGRIWYDHRPLAVHRWFEPAVVRRGELAGRGRPDGGSAVLADWRSLLGRGDGATPYGDDVLCGALLGMRATADPAGARLAHELDAARLSERTTPLSAALLRAAAAGWCIPEVADVVRGLRGGLSDVSVEVAALLAVGHSSGRGLWTGLRRVVSLDLAGMAA
jgi:hypothetical protein